MIAMMVELLFKMDSQLVLMPFSIVNFKSFFSLIVIVDKIKFKYDHPFLETMELQLFGLLPNKEEMMASTNEFSKQMQDLGLPKRSAHFLAPYQALSCVKF
ncbi:uncharacterized protein LOC133784935 [Humulus lupulus]|uniref:uncharacterized protein LOC133784935 n=1 Tax=Humulus lupulus TaxID=3486 RepID=UPI002B4098C6|nr:uncharacterized protein LOC133784935 [Humulus lupulus]